MQVNLLGAERRRGWSYDEKVRLVEETLQTGETVCGVASATRWLTACCSPGVYKRARGRLGGDSVPALVPVEITPVAAPISSDVPQPASPPACAACRLESSRSSLAAAVAFALTVTWTLRRCSKCLSCCGDDDPESERRQGLDSHWPHRHASRHAKPGSYSSGDSERDPHAGDLYIYRAAVATWSRSSGITD
ncbi:hypothetical protein FBZ94_12025 [Bradyrhizobium sacchari]|uniref:Transposase n=1 Tax=Bradyrhizobium sacchari TaxID=1399419 RepID=A0A560J442_9BRAD|nr:hypothetical protein FBZ94_12025 [Bradyrhizobium sacchari]TWB66013.1 hypothetical protein FBZ95_1199 [Bradyrhizobium sacchari]